MTQASPTPTRRKPSRRLKTARNSWTVRAAALVPVLLAIAEATRDQLPFFASVVQGWGLVALSVGVSAVIAVLRVRSVEGADE